MTFDIAIRAIDDYTVVTVKPWLVLGFKQFLETSEVQYSFKGNKVQLFYDEDAHDDVSHELVTAFISTIPDWQLQGMYARPNGTDYVLEKSSKVNKALLDNDIVVSVIDGLTTVYVPNQHITSFHEYIKQPTLGFLKPTDTGCSVSIKLPQHTAVTNRLIQEYIGTLDGIIPGECYTVHSLDSI